MGLRPHFFIGRVRCMWALVLIIAALLSAGGIGCSTLGRFLLGGWVADYETAEALYVHSQKPMLILYKHPEHKRNQAVVSVLADEEIESATEKMVKCVLYSDYEPNRRYLEQFRVRRTPALVIVYPEGTYRSAQGIVSVEAVRAFFEQAGGERRIPANKMHLPRSEPYRWLDDFDEAQTLARNSGKPLLLVLYHWLPGEWGKIRTMLESPSVYTRCQEMVHCKLSTVSQQCRELADELGVTDTPAVIIFETDGTYRIYQQPTGERGLVKFLAGDSGG